ncbi:MAG: M56 family metallopeptidase [Solirubrobacterales bacterium]
MTVAVAAAVAAGVLLPHLLRNAVLSPVTGAALCFSALLLRAALVVLLSLTVILYLPATALFRIATHWCFHAVLPFFATHLGFSGHQAGDAAALLPGIVLGVSLVWALLALWRAGRIVRGWLRRDTIGAGPDDSVIVSGSEVVVAAAGILSARVVVSAGALAQLDEGELAAGLEHERGHIARRHAPVLVLGNLAYALARPLPGSRQTLERLRFWLERDADEYAISRTSDPLALASAICKAGATVPTPALAGLAGEGTAARLRLLLDRGAAGPRIWAERGGRAVVALTVALLLAAATITPTVVRAGVASVQHSAATHEDACPD